MRNKKQQWRAVALVAVMAVVAGCGDSNAGQASEGNAEDRASLASDLEKYFAGTDRPLPDSGPTAISGKKVWVLACSMAAPGCSIPAEAAVEAGEAVGWEMTLVDGKLDPNTQSNQVRAAKAAGADGLITVTVDCPTIAGPLKDAVEGGMKVMSVYGYDCNNGYTKGDPLFSAELGFGPLKNYEEYVREASSRAIAAFISSLAGNSSDQTEVIAFREDDVLVTRTVSDGFDEHIKACNCVVNTVTFTGQDLISGKLQQKASAALSRFPNATVVMAPYDAAILLGIGAAVDQARAGGRELTLTGGEGLPANIELIERGAQQFAAGVPAEWAGWAAVDGLNRVFAGAPQVDEGLGLRSIDEDHPAGCRPYVDGVCVDFKTVYKNIWKVS